MSWTRVQQAQGGSLAAGAGASSVAATFGAGVGSGNLVVGWAALNGIGTLNSVTDPNSNTYVLRAAASGATRKLYLFYCVNVTGGPTVITANLSNSATIHAIQVVEYSNSAGAAAATFDVGNQQSQTTPGTGSDAISSGSFITTHAGDLVWGAYIDDTAATNTVSVAGTGYTSGTQFGTQAGLDEYQTQAAAGSIAVTFTNGTLGATDSFVTGGISFYPPATPSTPMVDTRPLFGF